MTTQPEREGREGIVEKFAELEHERWSKWQSWLHSQCFRNPEFTGALIIPADLVARWERQIATPYAELSEKEKESDRKQVYPYIEHFATLHQELQKARHDWLREEIVKLEGMKKEERQVDYDGTGLYEGGFNSALEYILDRYQSELDQPTV